MKKITLLLTLLILAVSIRSFSQGSCAGAAPFCTATGVNFPASTSTTAPPGPNYGCLGSQPNPAWYYLNIATSGNVQIQISSAPAVDIDFALWGPFATQAAMCAGISASPIDCSYSTAATEQIDITGAVAGQWYMMLITNFSGMPTNITAVAENAPGTDGTTNCAILCNMTGLTAVPGPCNPATNLYTVSGTITTTTPPTTGTLTITSSCGGAPIVMSPPFAGSIPYSFPGLTSSGGTCSVTATYSADPTCTMTTNYTRPSPCTSTCTATAANTGPYCPGATIALSSTGGGTYSWAGPGGYTSTLQNPTRPGATAAMAGTYTVTVTSGAATCTAVTTVVVNTAPTVTVPGPITVCNGANVPLTGFTSTPAGATFTWTNSNTTIGLAASGTGSVPAFTATNLTAAAVTATITVTPTLSGCVGTPSNYTITVNPSPTAIVPASFSICNGAAVPASGFTSTPAGATFSWTNSNTTIGVAASGTGNVPGFTAVNTGAAAVTATITVTANLAGCAGTPSNYTITVNPSPTVTVPANINICNGGNIAASAFTSTPAGGTFTWTNSNTAIGLAASGSGNTPAFTATNTGGAPITATITVTPTTGGCPGTPNTYTITVNPTPAAPTALGTSVCINNSATLTATAPGGTYAWYDAPGGTLLITNASYTTPLLAVTTTYYVQTTVAGCAGPFTPVTVTIAPGLTVNAGLDDTICFGQNTTLNVTPNGAGYTYSWAPGTGLSSSTVFNPTANPAATTTYTVTVTDPGGCVGTDQVTVFSNPFIDLTSIIGLPASCFGACDGQAVVIPSGGSGTYPTFSWTGGCTAAGCSQCAGTYTVTVTDSWGCTNSNSTTVTEPTVLTANTSGTTPASCNGVCDGTATAAGAGGTTGYNFSWNTVPVQTTATATGLCAGTYICTITDANGCTATTTATITEPTLVVIAPIASVSICFAGTTNLVASASGGNGAPYNYLWSPAAGLDFTNIANPNASPVGTTVYTVNATDANGCAAAPVNVTVTVNPALSASASPAVSICPGASTVITGTGINGSGGSYTYSWSPTTGLSNPSISNPSASPATTTVYTVTVNDGCSPSATATVTVTVLPLPVVTFSGDTLQGCSPVCVNFTDASTVAGSTITAWNWTFGDGTTYAGTAGSPNPPLHCYTAPGPYTIGLTVTSASGCSNSGSLVNYVTVFPIPIASFSANPQPASVLEPTVNFFDQSLSAFPVTSWTWDFGDGMAGSTLQNPIHDYFSTNGGTYPVTLTIVDANGCTDDTTQLIIINPEFTFFMPSAFSPNGDGYNDYFGGHGVGIATYEFYVFDRWGNMIFFGDELNETWDGKANHGSQVAQQDVYVWKVKIQDVFDKKHTYTGTVTIVK